MKYAIPLFLFLFNFLSLAELFAQANDTTDPIHDEIKYPVFSPPSVKAGATNQISNEYMPVIGVWVWGQRDLLADGYKKSIDEISQNSPFNLIVPFLRFHDKELMDDEVYSQVKLASEYAAKKNIGLLPDLDVRSARRAFQKQYPDELQEMLRIKEVTLHEKKEIETSIRSIKDLNDHYSGGNIPKYNAIKSNLLRVYAYDTTAQGIDPTSLKDITAECEVVFSANDSLRVSLPSAKKTGRTQASVMTAFTLFYPDVFAPHLLEFQRSILEKYSDIPLPGACKDEWGFPPYYPRFYTEGLYDYWYSKHRATAYAERTNGRDLLADCLMMAMGIAGQDEERQMAINHFEEMSLHRNTEIETDFYDAVKEFFGPDAAVTVHSTWWPYPDFNEAKKNGLVWWASKRDWAQTDELTPFAARTALSKKWDSPLWYNMFYTDNLQDQVWASALAGGRINYLGFRSLFDEDIMQAENRIRLLNYISKSPLDCRTAVIFGHSATMNWAGPYFNDTGMELADTLWHEGYPADLIPTSEIENGSLIVDNEGYIRYGDQRYEAVVLYHPEFEKESTAAFFQKASNGSTALFRIGDWTKGFNGKALKGNEKLPEDMTEEKDYKDAVVKIIEILKTRNVPLHTPATAFLDRKYFQLRGYEHVSYFPPNTGFARLIDGTHIQVAGTHDISGDPIKSTFAIDGYEVSVDAIGVLGVRLDDNGNLEALVASDLKDFETGNFKLSLKNRTDVALWKDEAGNWEGVIQTANADADIPEELSKITNNWTRLLLPTPPDTSEN